MIATTVSARADVEPHPLFRSGAVLQQNLPIPVWGKAGAREKVSVTFDGQTETTVAGTDGKWRVNLPKHGPGGPFTLLISGHNKVELSDVLVGDVYICSGQSNMEWPLSEANNSRPDIKDSRDHQLRLFRVERTTADQPLSKPTDRFGWQAATPENVFDFSAVGYYFGHELRRTQKVPIGLIESAWGGTVAEAWTSTEALQARPALANLVDSSPKSYKADDANHAARLYNGMIAPLIPYGIRGVIWYQGESNAARAEQYRVLFPTLIEDWRARWGQGDFPFLFVQLAPYQQPAGRPVDHDWAHLREAQRQTSLTVPYTAMAVITDAGDADIHPRNKRVVAERLALAARHLIYGENLEWSGPTLREVQPGEWRATLLFGHTGKGLMARNGELTGFTVAGADGVFHDAIAKIVAPDQIEVRCNDVQVPKRVRYGWDVYPKVNLYNDAGLPASPFETTVGK